MSRAAKRKSLSVRQRNQHFGNGSTPRFEEASSNAALKKFQDLLRELFEFDCADLDFGIYRIMNHKRQVIERFIAEDLPKAIAEELQRGALAEQGQAQQALAAARQKVVHALGADALDANGNLAETHRNSPAGKAYLEAQAKAQRARSTEALETAIYNHLYTFFSRYWQDGDFISKRRYSKKERYAIPYNGEEVYLYWANRDQYYIKTGEYFTDYSYKAPNGVTVHFKLQQADVEQNNVKGEKRFFLPVLESITWDETARILTIPFQFRPLTEQENNTYGQKNQQEAIIAKTLEEIIEIIQRHKGAKQEKEILASSCLGVKHTTADGKPISYLEHHLRQYTRRNTSDFFIHKDLRGFLSRELDFYLKNEVLNLEELEAAGEELAEGWFQLMRLIKRIGNQIIDLLAQIENFQKMLWEKKKFVTETFYVITVGNIAEDFYPEIAACKPQWEEWQALGFTQEFSHGDAKAQSNLCVSVSSCEDKIAFLHDHPTLPLDTRHFSQDFTDRLLASFDNLDDLTDGLLVHSENWQTLNLLQEKYCERVKCVYIDPPYNTGTDNDFLYKDNYQHSSWSSMMFARAVLARILSFDSGALFVSTDDGEYANLRHVLGQAWGEDNFIADIIWNSRKSVSSDALISVATNHTTFFAAKRSQLEKDKSRFRLPYIESGFSNPDNDPRGPWKLDPMDAPNIRENLTYPIINPSTGEKHYPPEGRCWRFERWQTEQLLKEGRIVFGRSGTANPMYKRFLSEAKEKGETPTTLWDDVKTTTDATKLLLNLFGTGLTREYINKIKPKPHELVERCVTLLTDDDGYILDYFAGSGTTGHAVINLNREDGGRRKFILVEMADYFDTVLLPRLKKVTFSPEWKEGKPKRVATAEEAERGPRIIKIIRLESYEDALNNITFDESSSQQALELFKEEYLLQYMLKWETRHSETLLDVEKLQSPFSYKLRLHRDGETRERAVDLPETFNYLIGLEVETRRVYPTQRHKDTEKHLGVSVSPCETKYLVYRGTLRNGRKVAVIWRETTGWTKEHYERDRDFVAEQRLAEGADEIFVNGDSLIPGAQSLDPIFKARMFAGAE